MSFIDLQGVSKHYGKIQAVEDISLQIEEGKFVTILGPSGSGKTTLLTLLAGFEQPTKGTVLIDGQNMSGVPPHKRNIGLVFQSYALFPHMSVYDNIAFPLTVRKHSKQDIKRRVREVLEMVKLEGFEGRRTQQLSGGQQQRVALARAIAFHPQILLLDEPMAALDRKLRYSVQLELRQLQRSLGITTIAVTHDQEEALTMSDQILILNQGRIEQYGTPKDLYARPANRFVAEFLGNANLLPATIQNADGKTVADIGNGIHVHIHQNLAVGTKGYVMIRPEFIQLTQAGNERASFIRGQVISSVFMGSATRYQISLENESQLIVICEEYFAEGVNVSVGWEPEKSWFIAES